MLNIKHKSSQLLWPADLAPKIKALEQWLREKQSVLIAFSGGVDSTFLAAVAHRVLGDRALVVTGESPAFPKREFQEAQELARMLGIRHRIIQVNELANPHYADNPPDRCYHCKSDLFNLLRQVANEEGIASILDGTNADDLLDYRPGREAAAEHDISSPFAELGFSKADIRAASRIMGLPTAEKPAAACLASRFPYGEKITREGLRAVERAEEGLKAFGFEQVRVRAHGETARIELSPGEIAKAVDEEMRNHINELLKAHGFRYVTLDLQGYRSGSLNEVLESTMPDSKRDGG